MTVRGIIATCVKWLVILVGLGLCLASAWRLCTSSGHELKGWLPLACLAIAFAFYNRVRLPGTTAYLSISDTLVCTGMMLFEPYVAVGVAALSFGANAYRASRPLK